MFSARLHQCFDSHLHWQATGDWAHRLNLSSLKTAEDVKKLKPQASNFRGDWLIGFGWDQNSWLNAEYPNRKTLDEAFPDYPVAFSRADGHSVWVNTRALILAGFLTDEKKALPEAYSVKGGKVILDVDGLPTGVLIDNAKGRVDHLIPEPSPLEVRAQLVEAMRIFHSKGITHIRDMSCSPVQWEQALHLDQSGLLKLGVLQTFSVENPKDFHKALQLGKQARQQPSPHLKPHAIKIYYDGALGSEGALLSQDYASGRGRGFRLLEPFELKEILAEIWAEEWDVAIHTIGDQAVHEVVEVACELWEQGHKGHVHLEHAELIREETLIKMKGRNFTCHLQPCHWLSDRKWAKTQLGSLIECIFPWRKLEDYSIPFYFGSDSPIEPVGVDLNLKALKVAQDDGIAPLKQDPLIYHQLQNPTWVSNSYSVFENGELKELVFEGEHLR